MTLSIEDIKIEIAKMNPGNTAYYSRDQFTSQEDIDQTYMFLETNQFELEIEVKKHVEMQSGYDNIDLLIVKKV